MEVGILSGNDLSESGFEMKRKKVKQKIDRKNHTARDCAVVRSDTRERRMCDERFVDAGAV